METRKANNGILVGAGAGIAVVALLVIQAAASTGAFGTRVETATLTTTETRSVNATQQAIDAVNASFADHGLQLSSGNVSAIVSQYERNATVSWTGQTYGFAGTYIGAGNIRLLLGSFLGKFSPETGASPFVIANATQTITAASDDSVAVNSTFDFSGQNAVYGNVSGAISARTHMPIPLRGAVG